MNGKRKDKGTRRPSRREGLSPPRRRMPRLLIPVAAAAVIALGAWWWWRTPAFAIDVNPDRNIVLVTIDTLRADSLGSYGGRAHTPNLDRLAARGARFDFAHAHAVVTLPSHASILSGRYPYEHGIRDNTGYRFPQQMPTAATLLKGGGFATGAFIGGFPLDRRFGLGTGFDVYDDRLGHPAKPLETDERERPAEQVVKSALDWIGRQNGKWFAWVHVYDPHAPYQPAEPWAARFPSEPYLGEVSWTDASLGALFDALAAQSRPTLVVVTSDHGEGLGDHGEQTHNIFAYEATLRVPLIVSEIDPGHDATGRTSVSVESAVRHVDVLPTLLESAGMTPAPDLPGTSLRPVIASGGAADRPSYFEAMTPTIARGWAPLRGVLVGREKFIDLPIAELYDLSDDPQEARNILAVRPDRAEVLLNTLKGFNTAAPGRPREETPETLERLRSLGYIGGGTVAAREKYTEADDPKRLIELEQTMTRAADAYREGKIGDAIEMYRSVIAKRRDTEDAYRKLALIYWRAGQPREAIATLEAALKNGVTQSEVRIKLGEYLTAAGQARRAIELLESSGSDDPDALIALGNAYVSAGQPADALRTFNRLLALDPTNGLAHQNIGTMQLQARNYAAAESTLRRAIELDPNLAGAHTALGVVLATTGRKTEAIDAWKRAVEIDRNEFDALYNLTVNLAAAGRLEEARTYGERYIKVAPPAIYGRDIAEVRRILSGR